MTKFIQLRNKFSNNILSDTQQKNTKGRGKGSKDVIYEFDPVRPSTTQTSPTTSFPTNNPKQGGSRNTPKGPPQFGPGGPMMGPVI